MHLHEPERAMQRQKVFIFGCARSGTTLLLNLCRCFADTIVVDREHCIDEFEFYDTGRAHVVLKRTPKCAVTLPQSVAQHPDVWIVDICRDPRDVITSVHPGIEGYYTDFGRWMRDIQAVETILDRHIRIRYENLVGQPSWVQRHLETTIGIMSARSFEEFVVVASGAHLSSRSVDALGGIRPLDTRGVGRWRSSRGHIERVMKQVAEWPEMPQYLVKYGYEPDERWIQQVP